MNNASSSKPCITRGKWNTQLQRPPNEEMQRKCNFRVNPAANSGVKSTWLKKHINSTCPEILCINYVRHLLHRIRDFLPASAQLVLIWPLCVIHFLQETKGSTTLLEYFSSEFLLFFFFYCTALFLRPLSILDFGVSEMTDVRGFIKCCRTGSQRNDDWKVHPVPITILSAFTL